MAGSRPSFAWTPDSDDSVRDRMAQHAEPAAAASGMQPAFRQLAFGIVTHKQEVRPFSVRQFVRIVRSHNVRLASVMEFDFVAKSAPGARYL